MFGRIVKYIVLLLIFVAIGIWFAENPGQVSVEWQGVIVDVPIALALVAVLVVVGFCALLYRGWLFIRRSPKIFGHYRSEKRTHKGYESLTKGLVAVAAGESGEAIKHARKANQLLKDPSLTMLLSAQAAQLEGDDQAATRFFDEMSKTKGMEFLGLRGLLNQAIARGDTDEALMLAKKAYQLKPKTEWLAHNLFELQLEKGQWAEAESTLDTSVKHKLVDASKGKTQKAALMVERARQAEEEGSVDGAIRLLGLALKQDPMMAPAALMEARLLAKTNKLRKAYSVIEEMWARNPHPALYDLYQELHAEPDALKRVKLAEKLAGKYRTHIESRVIIARAALEAQLWGEARDELTVLLTEAPSARVFALQAQLVETENGDMAGAREWLRKATEAAANPAWVCQSCGDVSADWSAVCGKCGGFDSKKWQTPPQAIVAELEAPIEAELVKEVVKPSAAE
ncbi:heme biosynthesis HemY N-terminal domain-containing protein [Terasakiella sp. A23]|uniref:heme biosynthesis protein HemY n=1 Tax=Terasakiella sp. FCG-A23 TaxID=3080561 RepID=UPI002953AC80|nr:heme biosynthesis HemY N-terminal domain-containing protein [Terasakiella sp. A23]MDV7340861.1 heme biosynthesis HemY N-terminal domain-containing protein [Terasakiella sp. A23]